MNTLSSKSYFVRLLISFVAIITITLMLSSLIIYKNYVDSAIRESSEVSEQMLSKTVSSADLIWDWSSKHAFELYSNNYIFNAIYGHDVSIVDEYNAEKIMSYAMSSNPFIYSIYLYNGNLNKVFSSFSQGYTLNEFYDQDILRILKDKSIYEQFHFVPRVMNYMHYSKEYKEDVISLIITENLSDDKPTKGALVLNIKVNSIQDMVGLINKTNEDYFVIVDRTGKVISHSQSGLFLKDISGEKYIHEINESKETSGYFTETINGKKSLVTFVKSDKLNWSFIRVNEYQRLFLKTQGLRNLIILFSILIFICAALFSIWLSWKFYSPIGGLVKMVKNEVGDIGSVSVKKGLNELEYISKAYSALIKDSKYLKEQHMDNYNSLRKEFLKNLLSGRMYLYKYLDKKFEEMKVNLELNGFTVLVLKIDDYWTVFSKAYKEADASLMKFAISNIAQEIISEKYKNEAVEMREDIIAIIINTCNESTDSLYSNVSSLIKRVQEAAGEYLKINISSGIGHCVEKSHDIHQAFKTALDISDYRLVFGKQCIILPNMVEQNINMDYTYSEETEKEILDNLRLKNYIGINDKINKFFNTLKLLSYTDIIISIQRIIYASVKTINTISGGKDHKYSHKVLKNEFNYMDTLEEIKEWMLDLFRLAIEEMNSSQQNGHQAVIISHVEKTINIINEEISSAKLTPEELASRLNLSVNYLREIFKEVKGVSLSNYINEYRFEKAKELLLHTDMPVSEISERVGLVNQNYFFTFFKKYSGFTPSQFRNKSKNIIS